MKVAVRCPSCDRSYGVPAEKLGKTARCKKCGHKFSLESSAGNTDRSQAALETPAGQYQPAAGLPERLGRFEIRARLGAGAFGVVYRAYDPILEREVALKVPHPGLTANEQDRQRYLREPKAAAKLRHPNIVPVFDANTDGENLFIAAAYIEGRPLDRVLEGPPEERPNFRQAAELVIKLAEALDYAHGQGIVHRDVKPANIMLDEQSEPLLMDFGLARIQESAEKLTLEDSVLGTPAYMSPEQAAGKLDDITGATDQYSLGVVLYELLCGERPFNGPPALVISLVINEEPPAPSVHDRRIPKDLETICLKAMAKEFYGRYATSGDLAEDLRRWLNRQPIIARPAGHVERLWRWSRRNPVIAAQTATAFALLILGVSVSSYFAIESHKRAVAESAARREATGAALAEATAKDEAMASRNRALRFAYAGLMREAQQDCTTLSFRRLPELLAQATPHQGEPDLRGWEWYFLNRVHSDTPVFRTEPPCLPSGIPKWSPDGRYLAHADRSTILIRDSDTFQVHGTLNDASPFFDWSPNSTRLAVRRSGELVVYDTSGTVLQTSRLEHIQLGSLEDTLTWSPDGALIASGTGQYDPTERSYSGELRVVNAR